MNQFAPLLLLGALTTTATAQIPCWTANLGTNLGMTDETMSPGLPLGFTFVYGGVSYTDIQVCDNGYVTLGAAGGAANFTPNPATLVGDPFPRICAFWVDLEPGLPGTGNIFFSAVAATPGTPAHAVITWLDVFEYFGSTPHTFQLTLIDGGGVRCSYGDNLSQNPYPWVVGASPGGSVPLNPVSFTALPVLTAGNPTMHESNLVGGGSPLAGQTLQWTPDATGGWVVTRITNCADVSVYGSGCVGTFASFYEWFQATPSIDLSNTAFQMLFTGSSYVVTTSATTMLLPSPSAVNLNLTDDSETTVTLASPLNYPGGSATTLNVCSNGHISTASNGAALDYTPTPGELMNWPNATWAVWRDMIPGTAGGGAVWFEQVGNLSIVTWLNVLGYVGQSAGVTTTTFQIQFDRSNGSVYYVFGSLDTVSISAFTGGEGWVVGFSPAGASAVPNSVDLSAVLAAGSIATGAMDLPPLALTVSAPPVANTTIQLNVANITPTALLGGILLGFAKFSPGVDLTSIGMPGCFQYNDGLAVLLFFPATASSVSVPFNVPNTLGLTIQAQAAIYDPAAALTPFGATSSNGLELLCGT